MRTVTISPKVTPHLILQTCLANHEAEKRRQHDLQQARDRQLKIFSERLPEWLRELCREINAELKQDSFKKSAAILHKEACVEEVVERHIAYGEAYTLVLTRKDATQEAPHSNQLHFWFEIRGLDATWNWAEYLHRAEIRGRAVLVQMGGTGLQGSDSIKNLSREAVRGLCLQLLSQSCNLDLKDLSPGRRRRAKK